MTADELASLNSDTLMFLSKATEEVMNLSVDALVNHDEELLRRIHHAVRCFYDSLEGKEKKLS